MEAALSRHFRPEDLRFDPLQRAIYATDASNHRIEPLGVAFPRNAEQLAAAVETCAAHGVSIVARGGGSGLTGAALGPGLALDFSRHMTDLAIDPEAQRARVEPGLVLDRLNRAAARHGLQFGPDPASADRATLGGMVGTNASGARSIRHGLTADHLLAASVVLADGSPVRLAPMPLDVARSLDPQAESGTSSPLDRILATLLDLVDQHAEPIRRDMPRYWRRSGGYALDRLLARAEGAAADRQGSSAQASPGWPGLEAALDPSCLLPGSEGSLALITELELNLVPLPRASALLVASFAEPLDPYRALPTLLETGPSAVELVDRRLLDLAREAPGYAADAAALPGRPAAILIVEYQADSEAEVQRGVERAQRALLAAGFRGPHQPALKARDQAEVWRMRKAGLGLLARMAGDAKPVAGIEDSAVPPERLADYMESVQNHLAEHDVDAAFYAHASAGCIHVRPILDLKTAPGRNQLAELTEAVADLALRFGGLASSEHGDGLARGHLNERQFGPRLYRLFQMLKASFDPDWRLNPGKVVAPPEFAATDLDGSTLRYAPGYAPTIPSSHFSFEPDGDILRAVERCNGAGVCRKLDAGSMCPSFMATREELHSTRGRANALRSVLEGRLGPAELSNPALASAMDLCLGCKACASECPSGVDMARLKIEADAARWKQERPPLRAILLADLHRLDALLCRVPQLANRLLRSAIAARLQPLLGIDRSRHFPALAKQTFLHRASAQRGASGNPPYPKADILLFADTFTQFHEPEIGLAALRVLEATGRQVRVDAPGCCGRPALSQGLIDKALAHMATLVDHLAPFAQSGRPIIVLEPSCASALTDEMPDLMRSAANGEAAQSVAAAVTSLETWLADLPSDALKFGYSRNLVSEALLHPHCHQRSMEGSSATQAMLRRLPGLRVVEPDAGCCGMAGAFGYTKEHAAISRAIAAQRLLPAVASWPEDEPILANGASCRQQIRDLSGRDVMHPVELVARALS